MIDLKKMRQDKGLTQAQLAHLCKLTTATINKAENHGNVRLITYNTIIQTLNNYDHRTHRVATN